MSAGTEALSTTVGVEFFCNSEQCIGIWRLTQNWHSEMAKFSSVSREVPTRARERSCAGEHSTGHGWSSFGWRVGEIATVRAISLRSSGSPATVRCYTSGCYEGEIQRHKSPSVCIILAEVIYQIYSMLDLPWTSINHDIPYVGYYPLTRIDPNHSCSGPLSTIDTITSLCFTTWPVANCRWALSVPVELERSLRESSPTDPWSEIHPPADP